MRRWSWPVCLCLALMAFGCSEPPNKEMDLAQGALDAARAAGADRYAATEFTAAQGALTRAREAVTQGDYRLALNNALDSRERAQAAARDAADTRARLRAEAERTIGESSALLEQVDRALASAARNRRAGATMRRAQATATAARKTLQEAGAAAAAGEFTNAGTLLMGMKAQLETVLADLDEASRAQSLRRQR